MNGTGSLIQADMGTPRAPQLAFQAAPPAQQPHLDPSEPDLTQRCPCWKVCLEYGLAPNSAGRKVKAPDAESAGLPTQAAF